MWRRTWMIGVLACILACIVVTVAGCSSRWAGEYTGDARLMPGKEETGTPGYTLDEIRTRIAGDNRSLTLRGNGRFEWHTGSAINEGTWRVEGDTLILRDDISNGNRIVPALRSDRRWRITAPGGFVTGTYTAYNIEEVYTRR